MISTIFTTLQASSVLLTFYPNFNLSLHNKNVPSTLKVHVQIQGAKQIASANIATLHHQLVYHLQNHAMDLPNLNYSFDTAMILDDTETSPTIIQISKQITKAELLKLMPLEWLTNYELCS